MAPPGEGRHASGTVPLGMMLMALGVLVVPGIDAIAKHLAQQGVPPAQSTWSRFAVQAVLMVPLLIWRVRRTGLAPLRQALGLQIARGLLIACATLFFFTALSRLKMADTVALFFVEPLILTLLSAWLLGEGIGWRRLTAVAVGFAGAMIVIRPGSGVFGLWALFPLAAAGCFALYLTLTRLIADRVDVIALQASAALFGGLVMTLALAVGTLAQIPALTPVAVTWGQVGWLILLGCIATVGHMMIVQAFKLAEAGVLAPFQYLEIVGAVGLGYLIFKEVPDLWTAVGMAVIIGSGLYVLHRETVRRPRPPVAKGANP